MPPWCGAASVLQERLLVRVSRILVVAALSVALVALTVAPAQAAELSTAHTVDTPPVSPSGPTGSDPKHFMLNVLGKMLGPLTPTPWKREQIAYNQRYNHDWETLEAQFGQDPANPNYSGAPDSYQDYVLKKLETSKKGGTGGAPMTAPATKISKPQKIASGVFNGMSYIAAAETGFAVGKTFSRAIGMNPEGGLCDPGFNDLGLIALVTATDCSSMNALSPEYQQALADNPSVTGGTACNPDGSWCRTLVAVVQQNWSDGAALFPGYCFVQTGTELGLDQHWRFEIKYTTLGAETWGAASEGAVAPSGNGNVQNVVYGCSKVGVPSWDSSTRTGGLGLTGCPLNGPTGCTNDPITYRMINPFNGTVGTSQEATSGAPAATIQCSITGDNGQTYTKSTDAYTDSSGKTPDPQCPDLPDGVVATHIATQSNSSSASKPIQSADTTAEYQDWAHTYPECTTGACKLDLKHQSAGVQGKSCFDDGAVCNGWFTDPAKADNYACTYGTHTVDLSQCAVYSGTFDPARIAAGAPYSDPMTGEWSGGQSAPTPDTQALGQKIQNPDVARTCNGMQASGFDPVAWVMRPIQCAFEWAFVPRAAVVQMNFENIKLAWSNTGPGKYAEAILAWHIAPNPQGCESTLDFPVPLIHKTITVPVIEACPGTPFGDYAGFIRGIVTVTLIVGAGFACKRIISGWVS
jgi:hypothetical protein